MPALLIESLEPRCLFAAQYTLTVLPNVNGSGQSSATAINSSGTIVGVSYGNGAVVATQWKNGVATRLPAAVAQEFPLDINDSGSILFANKTIVNGAVRDIKFSATAMNNRGDIAGYAYGNPYLLKADGSLVQLSAELNFIGSITDVNEAGQVSGVEWQRDLYDRNKFFYYASIFGPGSTLILQAYPPQQQTTTLAVAINNSGAAVGSAATGKSAQQAVLWPAGPKAMVDLGTLGATSVISRALDINDVNEIVGYWGPDSSKAAFVYHNGVMRDLNTLIDVPGVRLYEATDINNNGQILAGGTMSSGRYTSFLLTPITTGSISGSVYIDTDADGVRDAGEAPFPKRKIYIDTDTDGILDPGEKVATSDAKGNYTFTGLAAGSYILRDVPVTGWRQRTPGSYGQYYVGLAVGEEKKTRDFGYTRNVLISGIVFNDANADRVKGTGEYGIAGCRVFIDADNDGKFDVGEPNRLTDSYGIFAFNELPAGTYNLRVSRPAGWNAVAPSTGVFKIILGSGQISTSSRFGFKKV